MSFDLQMKVIEEYLLFRITAELLFRYQARENAATAQVDADELAEEPLTDPLTENIQTLPSDELGNEPPLIDDIVDTSGGDTETPPNNDSPSPPTTRTLRTRRATHAQPATNDPDNARDSDNPTPSVRRRQRQRSRPATTLGMGTLPAVTSAPSGDMNAISDGHPSTPMQYNSIERRAAVPIAHMFAASAAGISAGLKKVAAGIKQIQQSVDVNFDRIACEYCGKFYHKNYLNRHIREKHSSLMQ